MFIHKLTSWSEQDTEGNEDGTYVVQDIRRFGQGGEESCQLDVGVFLKGVSERRWILRVLTTNRFEFFAEVFILARREGRH